MKTLSVTRNIHNRVLAGMAAFLFITSGIASAQAGKTYSQLKAEHPGWMQVPGALVRPDCVHQIPSGAIVDTTHDQNGDDVVFQGKIIAHYDTCPEKAIVTRHLGSRGQQEPGPTGNGWVEASQWEAPLKSGDNIDNLYGYWFVPGAPAEDGALIFLFNGIEPTPSGWILQPVLQYGDNGNFGGNYWTLASWFVHSSTDYYVSSPIGVNPGDLISGQTYETAPSGKKLNYIVDASDQSSKQGTTLGVWSTGYQWNWAFAGVLEAYDVTSCSQFPGGLVDFFSTVVAHGYPKLENYNSPEFYGAQYDYFGNGGPQCNFNVTVVGTSSFLTF